MSGIASSCPSCQGGLPESLVNAPYFSPCPSCGEGLRVLTFPALHRGVEPGRSGERILVEGEAACFYHAEKRATVACSACGRFLCALCDLDFSDQHFCPACLETGQKKGKMTHLESSRILYDQAALSLALVPLLLWPVTLVTAPAAFALAIYSFRKPGSLAGHSRWGAWAAILVATLEIVGWGFLGVGMVVAASARSP